MNRFLTLGAAAVLCAGCGQIGLPGSQQAGTTEPASEPTQAASAPTVVYTIHQEAPPPTAYPNTNTVVVQSAPRERVVVVRESPRYIYRPRPRPSLVRMILRPVVRRIVCRPPVRFIRRPRYAPPPRPPRHPRPPRPPGPPRPRHGRPGRRG